MILWYIYGILEKVPLFWAAPPRKEIDTMAVSKANQRAVNKYKKNNYDRIEITVPKGQRAVFQAHASTRGESVNSFIGRAILEAMERDGGAVPEIAGKPAGAVQGAGVVSLPSDTLEAAQRASEAVGEALPDFVRRAVETQAERDRASLKLGINPASGEKQP